ncbi:MAG: hypothetical protein METHP_00548 [Methanoregula sp. SKADARSKE-2]|nr:MAG: hypothetical protein METHP_00548 [Methanoregula sp. SKADARSKE-2]
MTGTCSSTKLMVCGILAFVILSALTAFAYSSEDAALKHVSTIGLKSTAGVMAAELNASDVEGLKPGDEMSPRYLAVAQHLKTMRSMNDNILNAYVLKVNPDGTITFLVDDLYPEDLLGSARIGEVSRAPDRADILSALSGPTTSKEPYTKKYGAFMTAYAPIDDSAAGSNGNTYAILAIDISAKDYLNATSKGQLIILTGVVSIIITLGAIIGLGMRLRRAENGSLPHQR